MANVFRNCYIIQSILEKTYPKQIFTCKPRRELSKPRRELRSSRRELRSSHCELRSSHCDL